MPFFLLFFCAPFLLPRCSLILLKMARSTNGNRLWKETPATTMTKAQLLALANAKDMKLKELRQKKSEHRVSIGDPSIF